MFFRLDGIIRDANACGAFVVEIVGDAHLSKQLPGELFVEGQFHQLEWRLRDGALPLLVGPQFVFAQSYAHQNLFSRTTGMAMQNHAPIVAFQEGEAWIPVVMPRTTDGIPSVVVAFCTM